MFTGIIKDRGQIQRIESTSSGARFEISTQLMGELSIDDSVAVNGVCLTVVEKRSASFIADVVNVTLEKTTLSTLQENDPVNLELAMQAKDRFGGHWVQGHVGSRSRLVEIIKRGDNWEYWWSCDSDWRPYLILEGSVAIDGVSLTIAALEDERFMTSLIPHTLQVTNLGSKQVGDAVNIETDVLIKYVESLLKRDGQNLAQWVGGRA